MTEFKEIKYKINYRDIKSSFILKRIFSFLNEKKILDMMKYSNELQKAFLVNIKDYKRISGKYKIVEKNGRGREYLINSNILIFEGEYWNGRKNGNGKEYFYNGRLKFEGKYLNGKKWNGIGLHINGFKEFEIIDGKGNIKNMILIVVY